MPSRRLWHCPECSYTSTKKSNTRRHMSGHDHHGEPYLVDEPPLPADDALPGFEGEGEAPGDGPFSAGEVEPGSADADGAAPAGGSGRLRRWIAGGRGKGADAKERRSWRPPAATGKREPLDEWGTRLVGGIGGLIVRVGVGRAQRGAYRAGDPFGSIPTGRAVGVIAPTVAAMGDEMLKGTIVDQIAQPLIKRGEQLEKMTKILALPVLTCIAESPSPALKIDVHYVQESDDLEPRAVVAIEGPLGPMLYESIEAHLDEYLPIMQRQRQKRERRTARLREHWPDLPEGVDPVLQVIGQLFAPVEVPGRAPEEEAPSAQATA